MRNPKEAPSSKPINIEELLRSQKTKEAEPNTNTPSEKESNEESGGIRHLIELSKEKQNE